MTEYLMAKIVVIVAAVVEGDVRLEVVLGIK